MPSRRRGRDRARTFFAKRGNCSGVDQGSGAGSDSGEVSSTFGATFWSSPTSTRPRLGEPHSASWAVKYSSGLQKRGGSYFSGVIVIPVPGIGRGHVCASVTHAH